MIDSSIYNLLRPKTIDEMYPTSKWIEKLASMDPDKIPVASYMFEGPIGTGKTTLARAMARKINATTINEINAAESRGIDIVRKIKDSMSTSPVFDMNSVWIIDEVGETTPQFQKALMKEIEDTTDNTYVILCTTDPDKVIRQIKDRCIRIKTNPISENDDKFIEYMKNRINTVLGNVDDDYIRETLNKMASVLNNKNIVNMIVRKTEGSIRGIINSLYSYVIVGEMPDFFDENEEANNIIKMASANKQEILKHIMKMQIQDVMKIHRAIASVFARKIVAKYNSNVELLDEINKFLYPYDPSMARQVLITRLPILINNLRIIKNKITGKGGNSNEQSK